MKVIIAGSRDLTNYDAVSAFLDRLPFPLTEVVSGAAPGVDAIGERWANLRGLPLTRFPADWARYQHAAGPIRNTQMAEYADALIAFPAGEARGTNGMIAKMKRLGKPVAIYMNIAP